jgi:hypothetical protein
VGRRPHPTPSLWITSVDNLLLVDNFAGLWITI